MMFALRSTGLDMTRNPKGTAVYFGSKMLELDVWSVQMQAAPVHGALGEMRFEFADQQSRRIALSKKSRRTKRLRVRIKSYTSDVYDFEGTATADPHSKVWMIFEIPVKLNSV